MLSCYGDDAQLYVHLPHQNACLWKLNSYLHDVKGWMLTRKFQLNIDNTDLLFGSKRERGTDCTRVSQEIGHVV